MTSDIRRRKFLATLLGGAVVAWPLAAHAQQSERMRRIGVLMNLAESDPEGQARIAAFREGSPSWAGPRAATSRLNIAGSPASKSGRAPTRPNWCNSSRMSFLRGTAPSLAALQRETRSLPVVFAQVSDPVGAGFVASLARPGSNITGFAQYEYAIGVKWLELLNQIAPQVTRTAVIYDPTNPEVKGYLPVIKAAARSFGMQLSIAAVRDAAEIEHAIEEFAREPNGGLIPLPSPLMAIRRDLIISLARRHRLPNVSAFRYYPISGGLASYGVDNIDLYRRAASYVDRILKGEKPADLPIQQASKFELVINLKTAKALGLEVPPTLLARVDEVIE